MASKKKIEAMYLEYGKKYGSLCKDCCNLASYRQSRVWYKCIAYGESSSEATDWKLSNIACGLFGIEFEKMKRIPLIEKLKRSTKVEDDEPIKGQITF